MNVEVTRTLEFAREIIADCAKDKNLMEELASLAAVKAHKIAIEAVENANSLSQYIAGDKILFEVSVKILNKGDNDD